MPEMAKMSTSLRRRLQLRGILKHAGEASTGINAGSFVLRSWRGDKCKALARTGVQVLLELWQGLIIHVL